MPQVFKGFISAVVVMWLFALASCSMQKQISKSAKRSLLNQPSFSTAHIGIAVTDASTGRMLYGHDAEQLFVPASNTKLFSCYAGMKYLGDSLLAAYYTITDSTVHIQATGDPTFLHPDFPNQPLFNFLKKPAISGVEITTPFEAQPLGRGWAWDDYPEDYMAERDPFPAYGNLATFNFTNGVLTTVPPMLAVVGKPVVGRPWSVDRLLGGHFYLIDTGKGSSAPQKVITMAMDKGAFAAKLLEDTLHKVVVTTDNLINTAVAGKVYSQPTDTLLSLMMHRSDNFFAEQTLLMVSDKKLGVMNDYKIIDTLLKTDYSGLPQKPKWVDGSGLSRYNLFSPKDFVWILARMKDDFGFDRVKTILPTGNTGTLKGLYQNYGGHIFAKTGTLSNNVALSGYLLTKKDKLLIFSILVNNHVTNATNVRKGIEAFLTGLIEKY